MNQLFDIFFFCSSLVQTEPIWLRHEHFKFKWFCCINIDRTTRRSLQLEICAHFLTAYQAVSRTAANSLLPLNLCARLIGQLYFYLTSFLLSLRIVRVPVGRMKDEEFEGGEENTGNKMILENFLLLM